ncbi:hypothetical protein H696_03697 [Fonticula alba]|uniref:ATP-dependent RNA helicase DOB1 n=1 Tax=Fonticula alba TaxID=691883 RepID=A0A058Z4R6_FONAL|nr:hypothetical protein H696_03697 [Fonticula alba]KCV69270.1 hypothetical protein H696_03697 [Fonticula alba]|eukprot:XP_009495835.1 hypothetical protein H696_03697 [Fonticula alba]
MSTPAVPAAADNNIQIDLLDDTNPEGTQPAVKKVKAEATDDVSTASVTVSADAAAAAAAAKKKGPIAVVTDEELIASNVKAVRHEVAVPPGYPYEELVDLPMPANPARQYPFVLDPFQRWSVNIIERNESVLVSAHTSAGKTVIAEYAIAVSLRNKQRVIYTSPIKALSNQKYRELLEDFGDVGLMTGDVTINPNASCLVMTTEILRNMLYRGSEVMREVAWVIFDEIHYMRDKERGVVWEESIIMLPKSVHHVFLSATIPNAKEFADWICHVHQTPCHVVYTDYRPTPLQHYLFPSGGDGIYLVVDEKGRIREDNFSKAMALVTESQSGRGSFKAGDRARRMRSKGSSSDIFRIVKMIMDRHYQPVIIFAFSKREVEGLALQISKLDFNSEEDKQMVEDVYNNAIDSLSEDDKTLPQIQHILPLLKRGIGIHHGGLLPLIKEVIEILFQEGLIKVRPIFLSPAATFSMGLNMPARTVVFTAVRKYDGNDFRWVSSGEYTQMAGRAGRRGLDDRGIVIQMLDEKIDPPACRDMLTGGADNLNSAFYLSYNMILNLMRVEEVNPEFLLERSFFQFQNNSSVPKLKNDLALLEQKRDEIVVPREDEIAAYYSIEQQIATLNDSVRKVITHPTFLVPFLQPGRLVRIRNGDQDFGWGVVVNFTKKTNSHHRAIQPAGAADTDDESTKYVIDVLIKCASINNAMKSAEPASADAQQSAEMQVIPVLPSTIYSISSVRLKLPASLKQRDARQRLEHTIAEVQRRFKSGVPLLDPVTDMNITDEKFAQLIEKIRSLEAALQQMDIHTADDLAAVHKVYSEKMTLIEDIRNKKRQIRDATSIMQMDELKARKRVLRRLGFTSMSDVMELKGRVACEISTGDELLLTEMMLNGVFNDLSVEQICAILSCTVFDERVGKDDDKKPPMREELANPLRQLQETARHIARVSAECKLALDESTYLEKFKPELMDVVFQWASGAKFCDVAKQTEVFEGSIIRCIRRLEELLRQMGSAAKAIGSAELENKFADAITRIKRDIVFAASLYL